MGKITAIANQKGGVGKTTTAVNLSASLALLGHKTLIVDLDAQGNATSGVGVEKSGSLPSVYEAMIGARSLRELVLQTAIKNLFLLPSNQDLAGAEVELVNVENRENLLKGVIEDVRNEYNFIFIDCPPSLGLLTVNALTCADGILVPLQCEYYALEGLSQLLTTLDLVKENLNQNLQLEGVLLTMVDFRTNLSMQVVGEAKEYFKEKIFRTVVPRNVRVSEAPSFGKPVVIYDPRSQGAEAYRKVAEEWIERAKHPEN